MGDDRHCCPGQDLEIKRLDATTSDIIVPRAWVKTGKINPITPVSLRRSVDMTVTAEFKRDKDINEDDPNKPVFHVHGGSEIEDLKTADEFWTSFAYYPTIPAFYSWSHRISGGWWSPALEVDPEREDVLGRVYLLALDKSFYATGDRICRIEGYNNMNADV